ASLATHGSGGKAPNHFCNSCDAAAIADLPAVSLSTLEDNRALWSTPADTLDQVDTVTLRALEGFLPALFTRFCSHPQLAQACEGGIRGFASLN
ncbi:MAG TPA: hypothetical protein DCZ69_18600, partial [Syntrophobacteraceae bacterium]|nr:hypothetical protein [Syntrophobacteraceae bacterium]